MKQKLFLLADIMIILAAVGLVALNMWVCRFPEWVILIAVLLVIAVNIFYLVKFKTKLVAKIALPLISVIAICFSLFGSYCNPYWNSLLCRSVEYTKPYDEVITYKQAKADIDYIMHYLKKCHPLFVNGTPDNVQQSYNNSIERLQSADEITVNTLRREAQQIMSVLGDGHTSSWGYWDQRYLKTIPKRNAEGWKLVKINSRELKDIFDDKKHLFSYEVESWGMETFSDEISTLSGLDFLGLDVDGITYTWQNDEGEEETDIYTAGDFITYSEYLEYNKAYLADKSNNDFVSYKIDSEKSLAVLTLTSCEYNDQYINCLKEMFTEVKAKGIRNVAVDIRGNGGGSSLVANEFIRYLNVDEYMVDTYKWRLGVFTIPDEKDRTINEKYTDLTFDGEVFVLTDTESFSSAMMFALYIKDNNLGTIIGEPPGNTPNGYGEVAGFSLPDSGILFQVSTKQFFRPDKDCKDILVMPDVECDSDKAMTKLYEEIQ